MNIAKDRKFGHLKVASGLQGSSLEPQNPTYIRWNPKTNCVVGERQVATYALLQKLHKKNHDFHFICSKNKTMKISSAIDRYYIWLYKKHAKIKDRERASYEDILKPSII